MKAEELLESIVSEGKQITNHIYGAIQLAIENEMMSLSIKDLNAVVFEYLQTTSKYKPSQVYEQIGTAAQEELKFRIARQHRQLIKEGSI